MFDQNFHYVISYDIGGLKGKFLRAINYYNDDRINDNQYRVTLSMHDQGDKWKFTQYNGKYYIQPVLSNGNFKGWFLAESAHPNPKVKNQGTLSLKRYWDNSCLWDFSPVQRMAYDQDKKTMRNYASNNFAHAYTAPAHRKRDNTSFYPILHRNAKTADGVQICWRFQKAEVSSQSDNKISQLQNQASKLRQSYNVSQQNVKYYSDRANRLTHQLQILESNNKQTIASLEQSSRKLAADISDLQYEVNETLKWRTLYNDKQEEFVQTQTAWQTQKQLLTNHIDQMNQLIIDNENTMKQYLEKIKEKEAEYGSLAIYQEADVSLNSLKTHLQIELVNYQTDLFYTLKDLEGLNTCLVDEQKQVAEMVHSYGKEYEEIFTIEKEISVITQENYQLLTLDREMDKAKTQKIEAAYKAQQQRTEKTKQYNELEQKYIKEIKIYENQISEVTQEKHILEEKVKYFRQYCREILKDQSKPKASETVQNKNQQQLEIQKLKQSISQVEKLLQANGISIAENQQQEMEEHENDQKQGQKTVNKPEIECSDAKKQAISKYMKLQVGEILPENELDQYFSDYYVQKINLLTNLAIEKMGSLFMQGSSD